MSSLKSGRHKNNLNLSVSSVLLSEFELRRFAYIIKQIGGDASKWSLKKEWIVFYKMYFNTSSAKPKYVRACYDFFADFSQSTTGEGENTCTVMKHAVLPSVAHKYFLPFCRCRLTNLTPL